MIRPTTAEAHAALKRALEAGADYVIICSRRQQWLLEAAELCVDDGFLEPSELIETDEQSSELRFRFTEKGRALIDSSCTKEQRCGSAHCSWCG